MTRVIIRHTAPGSPPDFPLRWRSAVVRLAATLRLARWDVLSVTTALTADALTVTIHGRGTGEERVVFRADRPVWLARLLTAAGAIVQREGVR